MIITINLPPEVEAALSAQAQAKGLDLAQYAVDVLREQLPPRTESVLSPAERVQAWRDVRGLPHTAPLSDEAISRESSDDRG